MEGNSSGEELVVVKTRKPYTITKQRERWTEEEHNRFLEALKLYGRAWQRIEEHIGTKTAVQIRSHAQKFFTKLEKEAIEKGIPPGHAHDIEIPPPRPKRKPTSPYPRKSRIGSVTPGEATSGKPSLHGTNKVMDIEISALQETFTGIQKLQNKEISEYPSHSEVLNVFQDDLWASISSVNKSSSNHSKCMEFLLTKEKMEDNKSSAPHEVDQYLDKNGEALVNQETEGVNGNCSKPHINLALEEGASTSKLLELTYNDYVKGDQTHPNRPDMYIMGRNGAKGTETEDSDRQKPTAVAGQVGVPANANPSMNPIASAIPVQNVSTIGSMHHPFPALPPFTHFHSSQDACRSLLNISSTFSNLINSTLIQNPAVHAAARLAASFWPSAEVEISLQSTPEFLAGEIPERNMNPTPSLEAIAAVTVAAAAAWWAAQGLLPWFPPLGNFAFAPPNTTTVPATGIDQLQQHGGTVENPLKEGQQVGNQNQSEDLKLQLYSSKSLGLSLASDDPGTGENSNELKDTRSNKFKPLEATGFHDSDKERNKKKQDRSSCASNTPSSSEVETDTIGKQEKVNDEAKKAYFSNFTACEANHRRLRSSGSMNESWKEVSEEGRLAFQALFMREVLPQSFSPPHAEEAATTIKKGVASQLPIDANKNVCSATDLNHLRRDTKEELCISSNDSVVLGKLKVRRTGFKPYKRCSAEANENRAAEETGNKRIRLQGEASI